MNSRLRSGYELLPTTASLPSEKVSKVRAVQRVLCTQARKLLVLIALPFLGLIYWVSVRVSPVDFRRLPWTVSYGKHSLHQHYPLHIVFEDNTSSSNYSKLPTMIDIRRLPDDCIDSYFAHGTPCSDNTSTTFDVLWTWANATDPYFIEAFQGAAAEKEVFKAQVFPKVNTKLYRDHDELRHSVRSVLQHFRPYVSKFHILTSDFPHELEEDVPEIEDEIHSNRTEEEHILVEDIDIPAPLLPDRHLRLGQVPWWLNPHRTSNWTDEDVTLDMRYQSQIFKNHKGPSFNSYGIESQFPYLKNMSENFLYLNDDFFMTADLEPSDFFTSSYGHVLRMQADLLVTTTNIRQNVAGEWGPLQYTNGLLNNRFGIRSRPYVAHVPKSLSMPLLHEISQIWETELDAAVSHKFRGMDYGHDAYLAFLFSHFVVERYREALLWMWVVAHIGGLDDEWGEFEKLLAWTELGGNADTLNTTIPVVMTLRETATKSRVDEALDEAEEAASGKTAYTFVSGDGYPYGYKNLRGGKAWPRFTQDVVNQRLCNLNFHKCFTPATSASEAFKIIAFEKPEECGDCIIHALRGVSGPIGLESFIPTPSRLLQEEKSAPMSIPHLPLVKDWRNGDFSLTSVITGTVNVRSWALRLLERYRFVLGETEAMFAMIRSETQARYQLSQIDKRKDIALLCLNDDVVNARPELADRILRTWLDRRFITPAAWEIQR